jgi:hypothetical protein
MLRSVRAHTEVRVGAGRDSFFGAVGRVGWTFFAVLTVFFVWAAVTGILIRSGAIWAYALAAVESLVFLSVLLGLRVLWRDHRYW